MFIFNFILNILDIAKNQKYTHGRIQNSVKHLTWGVLRKNAKPSNSDV